MKGKTTLEHILSKLLTAGENEVIEFKEAHKGKWPDFIGKYVSALSNEANLRGVDFGWLCFGVADKPKGNTSARLVGTHAVIDQNLKYEISRNTTNNLTIREVLEGIVEGKRILILKIPAAPRGIPVAWDGKYYGRNGDSLTTLSTDKYDEIRRQSGIYDWSSEICPQASLADLDERALALMREKYAIKQRNEDFQTLPPENMLSDLDLMRNGGITNAAVILAGRKEFIQQHYPNAAIRLEYRESEADIAFLNRIAYEEAFFLSIDKLWHDINVRNISIPISDGPYIFQVHSFDESVMREAICNAVAHRDYRIASETLIKQYPHKITITNAGGFPPGVTADNLLTVPSTPRNRLLSDVMAKTGLVERSGQGVDKIYRKTLSEGKPAPDYGNSNSQMVELVLSTAVVDKPFAIFIDETQRRLSPENKMSVFEIIALDKVRGEEYDEVPRSMLQKLLKKGIIEKSGTTKGTRYYLAKRYFELANDVPGYMNKRKDWDPSLSIPLVSVFLSEHDGARFKDIEKAFDGHLSTKQVKALLKNLLLQHVIYTSGKSSGTRYHLARENRIASDLYMDALKIGMSVLEKQASGYIHQK